MRNIRRRRARVQGASAARKHTRRRPARCGGVARAPWVADALSSPPSGPAEAGPPRAAGWAPCAVSGSSCACARSPPAESPPPWRGPSRCRRNGGRQRASANAAQAARARRIRAATAPRSKAWPWASGAAQQHPVGRRPRRCCGDSRARHNPAARLRVPRGARCAPPGAHMSSPRSTASSVCRPSHCSVFMLRMRSACSAANASIGPLAGADVSGIFLLRPMTGAQAALPHARLPLGAALRCRYASGKSAAALGWTPPAGRMPTGRAVH